MDQAKLGKETQAALREKEDEAKHWKKLYVKATGSEEGEEGEGEEGGADGNPEAGDGDGGGGAGALGVDGAVKLQAQVRPYSSCSANLCSCVSACVRAAWLHSVVASRGRGGEGRWPGEAMGTHGS